MPTVMPIVGRRAITNDAFDERPYLPEFHNFLHIDEQKEETKIFNDILSAPVNP